MCWTTRHPASRLYACSEPVLPFQPKYRLGHPENSFFLLKKYTYYGIKKKEEETTSLLGMVLLDYLLYRVFTVGISHGYILVEGESTCSRLRAFALAPGSPTALSDWGSDLSRCAAFTHAKAMNSVTIAELADMTRVRSFLVPHVVAVILSKVLPAPCVNMSFTYHQ